jgi:hypothetical protein
LIAWWACAQDGLLHLAGFAAYVLNIGRVGLRAIFQVISGVIHGFFGVENGTHLRAPSRQAGLAAEAMPVVTAAAARTDLNCILDGWTKAATKLREIANET